jgi:transcription elongation factor Elf1
MSPVADVVPDLNGFATCPLCHTADSRVTTLAVSGGAAWHCARCGQRWDALRLETVAAYAVWLAERTAAPTVRHQPIMKADDVLVAQEQSIYGVTRSGTVLV